MENKKKYHGVVVPLITPFDKKRELDITSLKKILDYTLDAGTFPFILGTTGEGLSMPLEHRLQLAKETAVFVDKRTLLYAGISDTSMANTLHLADLFKKSGIDVFVAHLPPYYPLKEKQIFDYFTSLADRLPGPLMIYNIPSTTHVSVPLDIIDELSHHNNICGLKDSERTLDRIQILGERYAGRQDFAVLSGWTIQSLAALQAGFDGIVPNTSNLIPALFVELYETFCNGNAAKALEIQHQINKWADLHQKGKALGDIFAGLKVLLQDKGLCQPYMLPPLSELEEQASMTLLKEKELLNAYDGYR